VSSLVVTDSTAQLNDTNSDPLSPTESKALVNKINVGVFFTQIADSDNDEIKFGTEREARYTFCIAEEKLQECPKWQLRQGWKKFRRFSTQDVS